MRFGVDGGADQRGIRAYDGVLANHGMTLQEATRQDHGVAADDHIILDPRGLRVENVDAFAHPMLAHTQVMRPGQRGKLHAVVHAFHAQRVRRGERADGTFALGRLQRVGQIKLALCVVGVEALNRFGQHRRIEHIHGSVHLMHGQFAAVGVLLLHDAQHVAFAVADDTAITGRIVEHGGEHGGAVAAVVVEFKQCAEGFGIQQRHVGGGDEHGAGELAVRRKLFHGALHGTAGAGLVVLFDDDDMLIVGTRGFGHSFALESHDHGEGTGVQRGDGIHDTVQEGFPCKSVQHLRLGGLHAGAFACGENNCGGQCRGCHKGAFPSLTDDATRRRSGALRLGIGCFAQHHRLSPG